MRPQGLGVSAMKSLTKRRIEFSPVRLKLDTFARELRSDKFPEEETEFIHSLCSYFPALSAGNTTSVTRAILLTMESTRKNNDLRRVGVVASAVISQEIKNLDNGWNKVCKSYFALELKVARLP